MPNKPNSLDGPCHLEKLSGLVLSGKYQLTKILGSGGMGFVYEAEQIGLGRSVAVKLLRPELVESRLDWFRAEAMAASRINHPHAVAIYDFGITDEGVPYLVMEHIRGRTLSELIAVEPLSPERVVRLAAQCLSALDEAHACGVVHCDLTANNVIVERLRDGHDFGKVIDFGLARLCDSMEEQARLVGTAEYVAPEQIRGGMVTPQTDIYAMGILLYEMVVGRTPFSGQSIESTLDSHLNSEPDAPHHLIPNCPAQLGEIIVQAMSKSPGQRPLSAAAMREEILRVLPQTVSATTTGAARSKRPTPTVQPNLNDSISTRHDTRLTCVLGKKSSALVGRKSEVSQIVDFCQGRRTASTMIITGPHGVGKARIVREAAKQTGASCKVFSGAADPSGLKLAWYPLLSVLEQVLQFHKQPTFLELSKAAARCGLPERDVPGLAEAFGLEGPAMDLELAVRRREARAAAKRTLLSLGRRYANSVIVFADVNRYDHPSLEIIADLQASLPDNLRLIFTSETPLTGGTFSSFDHSLVERIDLPGLPPQHARELTQRLVGPTHTIPDAMAIQSITGGSPAAVEQLAGWIRLGHGTSNVPSLLVDLVAIRINRLPAAARRVLQIVAIHGSVAPRALVESTLTDEESRAVLSSAWTGLLVVGLDNLTIPTDLVAQVISACTPADVRRRLHRLALKAYHGHGPAGIRANHAEESGEMSLAYDLYIEAGTDSVRRFDDPGAAVWYGRALSCARRLHAEDLSGSLSRLVGASVLLAEVLRQSNELGLATGVCSEAQALNPDDKHLAMLKRTQGVIALALGQEEQSAKHLKSAIGSALRCGEREFLCQCYLDLITTLDKQGKTDEATQELLEGINVITLGEGLLTTSGPNRLWRLGLILASRLYRSGKLQEARVTAQRAHGLAMRIGNNHARGRLSALLAQLSEADGDRAS
ncbi:MAG: protein kinase, partial [Kofleriaceae bacterium]|nr:protein kinase [Kofleriaceae bacterium]